MKIERKTNNNGNLLPSIIDLVHSIPKPYLFHEDYLYRHPIIIARRSISRILSAISNVIDEHDKIVATYKKDRDKKSIQTEDSIQPLTMAITELFESIVSYIEDCLIILKCSTPVPTKKPKSKFVHHWLDKANHPTSKNFLNSI